VAQVVDLLRNAKRPLIVAGGGVARSGPEACTRLVALLERIGCPSLTTQMGLGVIPQDHPLCLGQGGFVGGPAVVEAMQQADLVLAFGCRFSSFMWVDGPPKWDDRPTRKLVQIDIDPAALGQTLPLTLGLTSDAALALEALLEALTDIELAPDADWLPGWSRSATARAQPSLWPISTARCIPERWHKVSPATSVPMIWSPSMAATRASGAMSSHRP
jgi:acetolactate synthase-1/2/3 large subunit